MFRLALALGRTVAELQQTLSAAELVEWLAFYRIDPWGGYRADLGAAMVASTLANVHRTASSQPFTPDDFIPYARHPEPPPDHAQISAAWRERFNLIRRSRQNEQSDPQPSGHPADG
jgi:hypothetical protein